jgi:Spy/CpxP family protein refolding chaperone
MIESVEVLKESVMKGKIGLLLGFGFAWILVSGLAFAQGSARPGSMDEVKANGPFCAARAHGAESHWLLNPMVVSRLKLSDEQQRAFDKISLEHRENLIRLHARIEKEELALESQIRNYDANVGAVVQQIDRVAQARAELEKANARFLFALRKELTPEQWKQIEAFRYRGEHMSGSWN